MPLIKTDSKYYDDMIDVNNTISTSYLLGNKNDYVKAVHSFSFSIAAIGSVVNPLKANSTTQLGTGWISSTNNSFKEFNIGDSVKHYKSSTQALIESLTVIDKKSDNLIRFNTSIVTNGSSGGQTSIDHPITDDKFVVETSIDAIKYNWNLVENNGQTTYISEIDGNINELLVTGTFGNNVAIVMPPYLSNYELEVFQMNTFSTTTGFNYTQGFKIEMVFRIRGYVLETEYLDVVNGVYPASFLGANSLRLIQKLTLMKDRHDPNSVYVYEFTSEKGNTGYLNENYNNILPDYTVSAPIIKNASGTVINELQLTSANQTVEFNISYRNQTSVFSTATQVQVSFERLIDDESVRKRQSNYPYRNFLLQIYKRPVSGGSVIPNLSYYSFSAVSTTLVNAYTIKVIMTFNFRVDSLAEFKAANRKSYLIACSVKKDSATTYQLSDKVTLPVKFGLIEEISAFPGVATITEPVFLRHYENINSGGTIDPYLCVEDELVAFNQLSVNISDDPTSIVTVKDITVKIKARKTGAEFDLDSFTQDFQNTPVINGQQVFDQFIDKPYIIPSTEPRKQIHFKSRNDLKVGNFTFFDILCPFIMRWEYWEILSTVNSDFFNLSEPNNGFNHNWFKFQNNQWTIRQEVVVTLKRGNVEFKVNREANLVLHDYSAITNDNSIKSYDVTGTNQLYNSVMNEHYIQHNADTLIVSNAKINTVPSNNAVYVVFGLIQKEVGNVTSRRRFSSINQMIPSDTPFKSIDNVNFYNIVKATTYTVGSDKFFKGQAILDGTKISNLKDWTISCRFIYGLGAANPTGKVTENGIQKVTETTQVDKIIE